MGEGFLQKERGWTGRVNDHLLMVVAGVVLVRGNVDFDWIISNHSSLCRSYAFQTDVADLSHVHVCKVPDVSVSILYPACRVRFTCFPDSGLEILRVGSC